MALYQGNCVEVLDNFNSDSIDLIVTDPPYGINYKSKRAKIGSEREKLNEYLKGDQKVDPAWIEHCARVLVPGGAMYMFTRWDVWPEWYNEVNKYLAVKNMIVWVKSKHTAGDLKGNYGFKHELIMLAVKGRHIPYWTKRETNVWTDRSLSSAEPRIHPTQKPIGVIGRCIMNGAPEGGLILDPFAGSGTTLAAAKSLGYAAIGIEIDPQYITATTTRLKELP